MKKKATTPKSKVTTRQPSLNFPASSEAELIAEATSVASPPTPAAPTERKTIAQGKKRSAAALSQESQNPESPEGAKEGGELPRGWSEQRIEQLFAPLEDGRTLHQGWSPQCDKVPSPSEDIWGVLKTTSIQAGEFQPEHNKLLSPGLEPRPMIEVKGGDILLTCAGPRLRCGVSCLVRQTRKRLMMSGKMYRFRVDVDCTEARYVEAFLQTERARQAIDKMKTGSSDSGLNLTHQRFRQLLVPVAPLSEQRRIVAEIEKQFTRLEAGVAALRRVQANLKRYRAAVLKAACEGRLVPTEAELWKDEGRRMKDENKRSKSAAASSPSFIPHTSSFESGSALLARILTERRQNWQGRGQYKEPAAPDTANFPPIPEGWTWAALEAVSDAVGGFAFSSTKFVEAGYQVVKMANVRMGKIDLTQRPSFISDVTPDIVEKCKLREGDLVVTLTGTRKKRDYGYVAVVKNEDGLLLNQRIARVRPFHGMDSKFLQLAMQADHYRDRFFSHETGNVGQGNVGMAAVTKEMITLPPLAEQTRIVAEVERRLSVVEELEAVVSTNLQRATRLRQSILQRAFTGELET